jgi:hypothetical protein
VAALWGGSPGPRPTPRSACGLTMRFSGRLRNISGMAFYRRRLPHLDEIQRSVFVTWRLHDSLPPNRAFPTEALTSGQAFVAMDRLLEQARTGPFYRREPAIADMIVEAIHYNADTLHH